MAETNSRSRGEQAFDAARMAAIRERFHHVDRCPVTGDARIFLESGGGSLRLIAAIERVAEVAALPDQEARDNEASRHLSAILNRGRDDLRTLFGATGGQVISGETGTRLLYRLIRAVALSAPPGPVISCTLEHPASLDAAKQWAANTGRPWHEVPFDPRSGVVAPADYAAIVTPDTQIATVIHTSQLTGFTVDLAGIVAAVRATAPQCFVIVDGIQYVPHGAVAVEDYGADAYVFSPYKAYSRVGAGFAWLNERIAAIPHEHMLGGHADNWELGSRDPGLYAAQSAVTDYLCWLGGHFTDSADRRGQLVAAATAMAAHESYLVSLLLAGDNEVAGLTGMSDVTVIGPPGTAGRQGIVSFTLAGLASPDLVRALADRGIRVHARTSDAYSGHILAALGVPDCLRVSMCHYNTPDEVRALLTALAEIAAAPRESFQGRARPADHSP